MPLKSTPLHSTPEYFSPCLSQSKSQTILKHISYFISCLCSKQKVPPAQVLTMLHENEPITIRRTLKMLWLWLNCLVVNFPTCILLNEIILYYIYSHLSYLQLFNWLLQTHTPLFMMHPYTQMVGYGLHLPVPDTHLKQ